MRTITTAKGTIEVDFAWAPTFDGKCMIQYADDRRFPLISDDWDGLDTLHFSDGDAEQEYDWTGYTRLTQMTVPEPGKVQIVLSKEATDGNGTV